jgi:L-ectoine synthase
MIVRTLEDIINGPRDTKAPTWCSRRLLLKSDGVGFSLHDTLIYAGTETLIWYRNHIEAVYCIEGVGEVEVTETGTTYPIGPGTLYTLDGHERHLLRAKTQMRMICVFNPPLTGNEVHDKQGVYPVESANTR